MWKCKICGKPATQGRFDGVYCDKHAKKWNARFTAMIEEARRVGEQEAHREEEKRAECKLPTPDEYNETHKGLPVGNEAPVRCPSCGRQMVYGEVGYAALLALREAFPLQCVVICPACSEMALIRA